LRVRLRATPTWAALLLSAALAACGPSASANNTSADPQPTAFAPAPPSGPGQCSYAIEKEYPHDTSAFTEGLLFDNGELWESTGLVQQSSIRRVRLADGKVLQETAVPPPFFGEGLTKWKNELISVTWQHGKGFRWDARTLRKLGEFSYTGEGWGLTHDGKSLILSDGTAVLRFLNPSDAKVQRTVKVTSDGQEIANLNELEWVNGEVLANVWMTDQIVKIDPKSGNVRAVIDLTELRQRAGAQGPDAVLNGIAYDPAGKRLFVTGKNWPKLFQIALSGC